MMIETIKLSIFFTLIRVKNSSAQERCQVGLDFK